FAAPFGDRFAAGLNLKVLRIGFDCTCQCGPNQAQSAPITGAIDAGVQYIVTSDSTLILGASVRNAGLPLQFNDSPQADPLPGRISLGAQFSPPLKQYPTVRVRVAADVVTRLSG